MRAVRNVAVSREDAIIFRSNWRIVAALLLQIPLAKSGCFIRDEKLREESLTRIRQMSVNNSKTHGPQ